jgi:hypothetical protein
VGDAAAEDASGAGNDGYFVFDAEVCFHLDELIKYV